MLAKQRGPENGLCHLRLEIRRQRAQVPHGFGTDFFRRLMKNKELQDIPIIVVSGLAGRHLAVREPVAVLDKTIDPEEFGATVDRALGLESESQSE